MKDYQPRIEPYRLERSVYRRVLAVARDYERMVRDYRDSLYTAPSTGLRARRRNSLPAILMPWSGRWAPCRRNTAKR